MVISNLKLDFSTSFHMDPPKKNLKSSIVALVSLAIVPWVAKFVPMILYIK